MPTANDIVGLPEGATLKPVTPTAQPVADPSQISGLPAGATLKPIDTSAAPGTTGVSGVLNKIGETGADVTSGFVKGAGDSISGVSHILNKIPYVGETLAPKEGISALDTLDTTHGTAEAAGKGLEGISEFVAGDELMEGLSKGAKLYALAKKYPLINEMIAAAKEHPVLAKIITSGAKQGAVGGIEGGIKGAQQDKAVKGVLTGTALGTATGLVTAGVPAALTALKNPFRKAVSAAASTSADDPGFIQQIWKGEQLSQKPAQEAVQTATKTAGAQVGLSTAQPAGLRTLAEEPISVVNSLKKNVYSQVDEAAQTDIKGLYDRLDNINDQIDQTAPGSPEEARWETARTNQMQTIEDAKAEALKKNVNVDAMLRKGDALHTREMALRDFQKQVLKSPSLIPGNVTSGTPETVNLDSVIKAVQKLQDNTKYGAPRLEQALGKDGAKQLLDDLYAAQRLGSNAVHTQELAHRIAQIAEWTGLVGGGVYAGVNALSQ